MLIQFAVNSHMVVYVYTMFDLCLNNIKNMYQFAIIGHSLFTLIYVGIHVDISQRLQIHVKL